MEQNQKEQAKVDQKQSYLSTVMGWLGKPFAATADQTYDYNQILVDYEGTLWSGDEENSQAREDSKKQLSKVLQTRLDQAGLVQEMDKLQRSQIERRTKRQVNKEIKEKFTKANLRQTFLEFKPNGQKQVDIGADEDDDMMQDFQQFMQQPHMQNNNSFAVKPVKVVITQEQQQQLVSHKFIKKDWKQGNESFIQQVQGNQQVFKPTQQPQMNHNATAFLQVQQPIQQISALDPNDVKATTYQVHKDQNQARAANFGMVMETVDDKKLNAYQLVKGDKLFTQVTNKAQVLDTDSDDDMWRGSRKNFVNPSFTEQAFNQSEIQTCVQRVYDKFTTQITTQKSDLLQLQQSTTATTATQSQINQLEQEVQAKDQLVQQLRSQAEWQKQQQLSLKHVFKKSPVDPIPDLYDRGNMLEGKKGFLPLFLSPLLTNTQVVCNELGLQPQIETIIKGFCKSQQFVQIEAPQKMFREEVNSMYKVFVNCQRFTEAKIIQAGVGISSDKLPVLNDMTTSQLVKVPSGRGSFKRFMEIIFYIECLKTKFLSSISKDMFNGVTQIASATWQLYGELQTGVHLPNDLSYRTITSSYDLELLKANFNLEWEFSCTLVENSQFIISPEDFFQGVILHKIFESLVKCPVLTKVKGTYEGIQASEVQTVDGQLWKTDQKFNGTMVQPAGTYCGLLEDCFTPFLKKYSIITLCDEWDNYFDLPQTTQIKMWALAFRFTRNYTNVKLPVKPVVNQFDPERLISLVQIKVEYVQSIYQKASQSIMARNQRHKGQETCLLKDVNKNNVTMHAIVQAQTLQKLIPHVVDCLQVLAGGNEDHKLNQFRNQEKTLPSDVDVLHLISQATGKFNQKGLEKIKKLNQNVKIQVANKDKEPKNQEVKATDLNEKKDNLKNSQK